MKLKLYYAELELGEEDIEELEFNSAKKRTGFIADKVIGRTTPAVFLMAIEKTPTHSDIYVFEDWNAISFINKQDDRWPVMHLQEYESYEDAYAVALDMKEESPLCYPPDVIH